VLTTRQHSRFEPGVHASAVCPQQTGLLVDDKSHSSFEFFVVHHEDLLLVVREFSE
jgi:hypothetical protein